MTTARKLQYHFDQVGSYLRPDALKTAREQYAKGEITQAALLQVQHAAIKDLVDAQVAAGLSAVTDGEFNRSWWHLDFLGQLGGFEFYDQEESYKFHGEKTRSTNIRLTGPVHANLNHPFLMISNTSNRLYLKVWNRKSRFRHQVSSLIAINAQMAGRITIQRGKRFWTIWHKPIMIRSNISMIWEHVTYNWMIQLGLTSLPN